MLRQRMKYLKRWVAVFLTAGCLSVAAGAAPSYTPLYTSVVRDEVPSGWWGIGVGYPRILQLHHNTQGENNVLLATFEEAKAGIGPGRPGYPIYRSEDLGKSWTYITTVYDPVNTSSQQAEWQPFLYELPENLGSLKKGTLLLAGCSVDAAHSTHSCLQLYQSTDGGRSWSFLSTIAEGGGLKSGVWEPFLLMVDGKLLCYYSDSTEYTKHSQKLVYRSSSDGRSWSSTVDVVASSKQSDRPGMAVITKMGNGRYFMVYELVNDNGDGGNPVCCKFSEDGKNWGNVASTGTIITSNGKTLGSAPYCIWTPAGGSNGMLFVCGTFMRSGRSTTGTDYFVSTDYGATWSTMPHPIPYPNAYSHTGYSSPMALSADGNLLFVLNNPTDPNGVTPTGGQKPRARIEFALVELESGAASLSENQPGYSSTDVSQATTITRASTTTKKAVTTTTAALRPPAGSASPTDIPSSDTAGASANGELTETTSEETTTAVSASSGASAANAALTTSSPQNDKTARPWNSPLTLIGSLLFLVGCTALAGVLLWHIYRNKGSARR